MLDRTYERALVQAGFIAPGGYARGMPAWRERGLLAASLLVDIFVRQLSPRPLAVKHPFLVDAAAYDRVFGSYRNVYSTTWPGHDCPVVLRPDNLHLSVETASLPDLRGPVLSHDGILRTLVSAAAPLFRDRYIWPAVQVNELVDPKESADVLDRYRRAVEAMLAAVCLPCVTVRTETLASYARLSYLAVSCLPGGTPTVVATLFVMADKFKVALDTARDVVDVGFTGKVLGVVALHHRDSRGLALPSSISPVQIGVVDDGVSLPSATSAANELLARLAERRLRVAVAWHRSGSRSRARAERAFHRMGTPIVVGFGPGLRDPRIALRLPQRWESLDGARAPDTLAAVEQRLHRHDVELHRLASERFRRGMRESGTLANWCLTCTAERKVPVFGWTVPDAIGACCGCGGIGHEALVTRDGRFY
jgi:prolyl-tRNA synthetase